MAEQQNIPQMSRRRKVSVFLRQHEQWNAWVFFTLMSGLVMYCVGLRGMPLLLTPMLGIMQLYVLKISSLYVRRSTALAITGLFFAATPFYRAEPALLCTSLQVVVLYHTLVWVRGKRNMFSLRHFVVLGLAAGVSLLLLPAAAVFYAPLGALMLWCNRNRWWSAGCILFLTIGPALALIFSGIWPVMPAFTGMSSVLSVLLVVLMFLPAAVTIRRGRPERRNMALGMLLTAWLLGCLQPTGWMYFYPLLLPALLGVVLMLHKKVTNHRLLYALRALGLLIPFATLCAAAILPVYRSASHQNIEYIR